MRHDDDKPGHWHTFATWSHIRVRQAASAWRRAGDWLLTPPPTPADEPDYIPDYAPHAYAPAGTEDVAAAALARAQAALRLAGLWPDGLSAHPQRVTGGVAALARAYDLTAATVDLPQTYVLGMLVYPSRTLILNAHFLPAARDALQVARLRALVQLTLQCAWLAWPAYETALVLPTTWASGPLAALWQTCWWMALELWLPSYALLSALQPAYGSPRDEQQTYANLAQRTGLPAELIAAKAHALIDALPDHWQQLSDAHLASACATPAVAHALAAESWGAALRDLYATLFTAICLDDALHLAERETLVLPTMHRARAATTTAPPPPAAPPAESQL